MGIQIEEPVTVQAVTVDGVTGQYRQVVVLVPEADADALAAARIARGGADLYAADCRPVANAVADALVAAGLGGGE